MPRSRHWTASSRLMRASGLFGPGLGDGEVAAEDAGLFALGARDHPKLFSPDPVERRLRGDLGGVGVDHLIHAIARPQARRVGDVGVERLARRTRHLEAI